MSINLKKLALILPVAALMALPFPSLAKSPADFAKDLFGGSKGDKKSSGGQSKNELIVSGVTDILAGTSDIPYKTERYTGESLSLEAVKRFGMPVKEDALQRYVNLVGSSLARNCARPEVQFNFVVVQSPLFNAFAAPGGIIFVTSALVENMSDEAELAGVLAHEISHVVLKHALKAVQRGQLLSGLSKVTAAGMKGKQGKQLQEVVGNLQVVLFDKGLDKKVEFEADAAALALAYRTGYDPGGLDRVLAMLEEKEKGSEHKGSWFSTHPPLDERRKRVAEGLKRFGDGSTLAKAAGRFQNSVKAPGR